MTPIHELLNRIRWDAGYAAGADFKIGYYDRLEDTVIIVSMKELQFEPDNHFSFSLYDNEGELHTVPLHRIRQVFRNDELIWSRRNE